MIPDSFKQDLLNRVDIVDVVSPRVPLKKSGANWVGLCPFHGEKTASFTVSQTKQFYHCFGCGAHGNAIGFLMEYSGLGYVEALQDLASSVGMQLPDSRSEAQPHASATRPDFYDLLQRAAAYYREQLKTAERAIAYLKGRGLTGATAARYGIGYAPAGWQALAAVFARYEDQALVDCGLVVENEGKRYDRFRDRVVFPILNQRGLVIGFGGRVIDGETAGPKYLNSPETPVFEKGHELYGLPQARAAIRAANRIIVVEGYMDVIMLAQHGIQNAVATLGTATTPTHVQKLLRQADEVVFCFDGDAAGRRAAWHALEVSLECLADQKAVRFLFLPPEHDPDSYVRERGPEALETALADAQPLSAFLLATLQGRGDLETLEGRSRLIADAKPLVRRVAAPALRLQLVKACADAAGMGPAEAAGLMELRDVTIPRQGRGPAQIDRTAIAIDGRVERQMLACMLAVPELAGEVDVQAFDTARAEARAAIDVMKFLRGEAAPRTIGAVLEVFRGSEHEPILAAAERLLLESPLDPESAAIVLRDAQANLLKRQRNARHTALSERVRAGTATTQELAEYAELSGVRSSTTVESAPRALT